MGRVCFMSRDGDGFLTEEQLFSLVDEAWSLYKEFEGRSFLVKKSMPILFFGQQILDDIQTFDSSSYEWCLICSQPKLGSECG